MQLVGKKLNGIDQTRSRPRQQIAIDVDDPAIIDGRDVLPTVKVPQPLDLPSRLHSTAETRQQNLRRPTDDGLKTDLRPGSLGLPGDIHSSCTIDDIINQ
jgi:hypothetical protein